MKAETVLSVLKKLPYFTKQNLSLALNIEGECLNYWVKKLLKQKIIIPIKKGFYISSYYKDLIYQDVQKKENYLEYLANIIRFPSYISLEYVLSKYSFIPESVTAVTSITIKSPRTYISEIGLFIYRSIKNSLFFEFETKQYIDREIKIATLPKAIFDYLYLKSFESKQQMELYLKEEGRLNWSVLSKSDKKSFIKICADVNLKKMSQVVEILKKEKIL